MSKEIATQLLSRWHSRIRASQQAHYADAASLGKKQLQLGIPVVVLTTVVGASVFTFFTVASEASPMQVLTGLLSVLAAVLASLQTFLNYPAKQTTHLLAATRLSALKKTLEERIVTAEIDGADILPFIREVRSEWNAITISAPLLSQKTFEKYFDDSLPQEVFAVVSVPESLPPVVSDSEERS